MAIFAALALPALPPRTCCFANGQADGTDRSHDRAQLEAALAIIDACQQNRDRFKVWRCRYRYSFTHARSFDDAIAGRFVEDPPHVTQRLVGTIVSDGVRYLCRESPEAPPRSLGLDPISGAGFSTLPEHEWLTDGSVSLYASSPLRAGTIYGPQTQLASLSFGGGDLSPFGLAMQGGREALSPGRLLSNDFAGRVRVSEVVAPQRGSVVEIYGAPNMDPYHMRYLFDPARDYLCVRIERFGTGEQIETLQAVVQVTDARQVAGAWIPERAVCSDVRPDPDSGVVTANLIELLDVQRDPPLRDEDFVIEAADEISIGHPNGSGAYLMRNGERIGVRDLPRVYATAVANMNAQKRQAEERRRLSSAVPSRRAGRLALLLLLPAALAVALVARRIRRRRGESQP